MLTRRPKKRIEIIDLAKGLAIFMVILGHTSTNSELLQGPPFFVKVLYSIHMPLFFFLSGLSISAKAYKTWDEWRFFLRKNVLTVAIPYLIWGLVFCNFSFKNLGWLMYGSWKALSETGTVTSLWYLSCLFCARILVQIVVDVMERLVKPEKQMYYLIPAAVFMVIGVLLPDIAIGYPWCLNVAFVAAGCILMGIAIKKVLLSFPFRRDGCLPCC